MIKKYFLMTIIIIILILILFHLNEFLQYNNTYQILQVDKIMENYRDYYLENLPIIFTNHIDNNISINENMKRLLSPLTIKNKHIIDFKNPKYFINHNKDKLFILARENITLKLISPKEFKKFSKSDEYYPNLNILNVTKQNYSFIEVKLYSGNIIYIPRNWIINSSNSFDIYFSDTIFSFIFNIYSVVPFIINKLF
jgi:hypothetical protein